MMTFMLMTPFLINAQSKKTDANVIGHVVDEKGKHISYATVSVAGTTIGTTSDETGHYQLIHLPEGTWTIKAQFLGYKPEEKKITIATNETKEIKFNLERDVLGMEKVVITGDRNKTNRKDASVIVNTLTPKEFQATQSVTLKDGLNFSPGLRMETNCQNCGFTQARMNGMEGPYTQILINSRPVFSGLAGVYGLELIPSNMIERVEIIRGGGSALYGSNAIAGTINLILKDPVNNAYEFGTSTNLTGVGMEDSGKPASDNVVRFNTSLVSADNKTGMSLYGFYRDRPTFDANGDGFSELTLIKNTTIGTRLYHRFGTRNKITADFFNIKEDRRGGDKIQALPHMAGIAEGTDHNILNGTLTYEQFFREKDLFSVYASGQTINRDAYYGANQSLSDYGKTNDFSHTMGAQYNAFFGSSKLIFGLENKGARLKDRKLGYFQIDESTATITDTLGNRTIADQSTNTAGVFSQYEISFNQFQVSAGLRYDHYNVTDNQENNNNKTGNVISPRLTFKYDIQDDLQARMSYARGFRAPQIFDEDLHIETSGARQVIHRNDPELIQETSNSIMLSLDLNRQMGDIYVGFLMEGFYTRLNNAFANEIGEPDENGRVVYTRVNAEGGARVNGINLELQLVPSEQYTFRGGFTYQTSRFDENQEFEEKKFFRTPDDYGYMIMDWQPLDKLAISSSGNYTGKMLVPYFGTELSNPDEGALRKSERFFELGVKIKYNIKLNGATLQLYSGIKNMFNAYQNDFDRGIDRDPGYIYGPGTPRTIYAGLKIGNIINMY